MTNARARGLQMPYGDQALLITRERFERMGGFRGDFPMMEDYEMMRRLRRASLRASLRTGEDCRVRLLPTPVSCSPRRWQRKGMVLTTVLNHAFVIAYAWGMASPNTIYRLYYGRGVTNAPKAREKSTD
uniref:Uncharacterized protein n=2 Tax=Hemiselmis andersenii TaxID=464988 RepID=A0A7S0Y080_HEMAN